MSLADRHHALWQLAPFVFLLTEAALSRATGQRLYRRAETFVALGCGILRRLVTLSSLPLLLLAYRRTYEVHLPFAWSASRWTTWLAAFLAFSFLSYWMHRWEHRWRWLWKFHAVHHQGNDFNVALTERDSAFIDWIEAPTVLCLALFGFPESVTASVVATIGAYTYLLHTTRFGDFGWLGKVLATPSHHRVHHGVNPQYRDKNFSTSLILWDRLFGTFAAEREEPIYGTVPRFVDESPWRANLAPWLERGAPLHLLEPTQAKPPGVSAFALLRLCLVFAITVAASLRLFADGLSPVALAAWALTSLPAMLLGGWWELWPAVAVAVLLRSSPTSALSRAALAAEILALAYRAWRRARQHRVRPTESAEVKTLRTGIRP